MNFENIRACLPCEPEFRFDWDGLRDTVLAKYIDAMGKTPQNPEWHAEGDVWTHTMMVCDALAGLREFRALPQRSREVLSTAALLHDVGKIWTTVQQDGAWVSPHHGSTGAQEVRQLLWRDLGMSGDKDAQQFREAVCLLVRYHTLPLHLLDQEDPERRAIRIAANGEVTGDFSLRLLCMLARADVLGRICDDQKQLLETIELGEMLAADAGCLDGPREFASDCVKHAYLQGRNVQPDQPLYDDTWGEVILLCGLPGTGKDTWIGKNHPGLPVVSMDDIRRSLRVKPDDDQGRIVQMAREQAREYLRRKQPFIWNATSLTPMLRQKNVQLFEQYRASVRIVYLEAPWQENLRRNAGRRYEVPENVIGRMLSNIIPPERFEARHVDWICV